MLQLLNYNCPESHYRVALQRLEPQIKDKTGRHTQQNRAEPRKTRQEKRLDESNHLLCTFLVFYGLFFPSFSLCQDSPCPISIHAHTQKAPWSNCHTLTLLSPSLNLPTPKPILDETRHRCTTPRPQPQLYYCSSNFRQPAFSTQPHFLSANLSIYLLHHLHSASSVRLLFGCLVDPISTRDL